MATNSDITAAITSAESLDLTPAQMVLLLDRAIAEAVITRKTVVSYTIGGRTVQTSIQGLKDLRQYYQDQSAADDGSIFGMPGEFVGE